MRFHFCFKLAKKTKILEKKLARINKSWKTNTAQASTDNNYVLAWWQMRNVAGHFSPAIWYPCITDYRLLVLVYHILRFLSLLCTVRNFYLAQLCFRVDKDLAHFTLKVLAGETDAAFRSEPLAFTASTSRDYLPSASRQNAVTFQHQFVLGAWWRQHTGDRSGEYNQQASIWYETNTGDT